MALKPSSLRLLEDEFICQCSYWSDDTSYVEYLEAKLVPRWVKDKTPSREKDKPKAKA